MAGYLGKEVQPGKRAGSPPYEQALTWVNFVKQWILLSRKTKSLMALKNGFTPLGALNQ